MTTRITKTNLDGTIETQTTDTRTLTEKLNGRLTFREKLDIMYPTSDNDVTKEWTSYDEHKFYK
jgi:hypothetical protein